MKKLLVANWKMNKNKAEVEDFFLHFNKAFSEKRDAWVAPQSLHLSLALEHASARNIQIGSQNCSEHLNGAYTGEISALGLKDIGGSFVILGHSERRQYFQETSKTLNTKIATVTKLGLNVIYCVGETLKEREEGQTLSIIADQIHQGLNDQGLLNSDNLIIAYEPVWAIGTGKTATPIEAQEVHAFIRDILVKKLPSIGDKVRILYGGSVKPDNVEELLSQKDIDGALVGGASLKASEFLALCGDK